MQRKQSLGSSQAFLPSNRFDGRHYTLGANRFMFDSEKQPGKALDGGPQPVV
jgi:hypothetical protein